MAAWPAGKRERRMAGARLPASSLTGREGSDRAYSRVWEGRIGQSLQQSQQRVGGRKAA